eukprot:jgi/Ulvmu1/6247/UM028_0105.1
MRSESPGCVHRQWNALAKERYLIEPGGTTNVRGQAELEARQSRHVQAIREVVQRQSPGKAAILSTADVLAVGLVERTSRELLRSASMAEQLHRTTMLNHARLAMITRLREVKMSCREVSKQLQQAHTMVDKQQGVNAALRHQLRAQDHQLNTTKRAEDKSAMHKIHHNEMWRHQKVIKNFEHAKLWRLRGHTSTLEGRVVRDRKARERHVGQGTQELARLKTLVTASRTQLAALGDQISAERASIAQICSPTHEEAAESKFGIFASADGLTPGLHCLNVDVQKIHAMDAEARGFALMHLSDRFDQLRALSKYMRTVVATAACVYDTLDLSDTLDAINHAATELLEAAKARVLLLDAQETYLWCPQPDASGDEDRETHIRFPCGPGITMAALHARQLMTVAQPASHPEYDEALDAMLGTAPHALVVCPIMHPTISEQPVGVLQCFNKRTRDGEFTDADLLTAKLLCLYAAAAAINAAQFDRDCRCRVLSRRAADLARDISMERDVYELPGMISARAKELLGCHRARVYFLHPPLPTSPPSSEVNLQPLPDLCGGRQQTRSRTQRPPRNKVTYALDEQPSKPCGLEASVAISGQPAAVSHGDAACGFEESFDAEHDFHAAHVACVPLTGDTGETVGVLTVMRGWLCSSPPQQQVIWSEAQYAPFSSSEVSAMQRFGSVCAVAVQGAVLHERMAALPPWNSHITASLSMDQALGLCHRQLCQICPAEAMQIVFPLPGQAAWAWSPVEGVTRMRVTGLVAHVVSTGIPLRAGPISSKRTRSHTAPKEEETDPAPVSRPASRCARTQKPAGRGTPKAGTAGGGHAPTEASLHIGAHTARHAAQLYCADCDSIGDVTPHHLLIVPVADLNFRNGVVSGPEAKTVAVLKLVNKTGASNGEFSFVDENLVQAMARQAASALQMAKINEEAWAQRRATDKIIAAGLQIHSFADSSLDDQSFLDWICSTTQDLVCCDTVTVQWADKDGRLPVPRSKSVQSSGSAGQDHSSCREQELFVGIADASGAALGDMHLVGAQRRKGRFGPLHYPASEVSQLQEFGKIIGAFVEAAQSRKHA